MFARSPVPVLGFAGFSGAGKTTLVEQLIGRLSAGGVRVGVVKHAHHAFDVDRPGKDSHRHRSAGALEVLVASDRRWALMHEHRDETPPTLAEHIARLSGCQLILVEGYKHEDFPKIEVYRPALGHPLLQADDPRVVAVASDTPLELAVPCLDLNRVDEVLDFVLRFSGLSLSEDLSS